MDGTQRCQLLQLLFEIDMKIIATVLLIAFGIVGNPSFADADAKTGIMLDGKTLKALFHGKYKVLKQGEFYGYGWLDDHRVFIAYQQEGYAEAIVDAEVVDLKKDKVSELGTIMEAHGESNFDVNSHTGQVVFNGFGDKAPDGAFANVIRLMTFDKNSSAYNVETIKKNIDCTNVLWVNNNTVGATLNDGHGTHVTIPVPNAHRPE